MPNFDKDILIKNIKQLMKDNNITQPKLAKELNIGQPSISKCLSGKQSISIELVYQIAHHFNVSIDSLCQDQSLAASAKEDDKPQNELRYPANFVIPICTALATVFKNATLRTHEYEVREEMYLEDTDEYGQELGRFSKRTDSFGLDPANKYISLYFPNYTEIQYSFDANEDAEEYFCILHECGNAHETNMYVNRFLKKLTDLLKTYNNDSMSLESYHNAIDDNLSSLIQTWIKP